MSDAAALHTFLPARDAASADAVLDGFLAWTAARGLSLYAAQEQAILELFAGKHVVLATPTGSGKSLVAYALAAKAVAEGKRLYYTAPIKALASEKFFELCALLGEERVGLATGDAGVNRDADVIVCTAEILAQLALKDGADADVDYAVMDELHYYADPERGWAWQVPMLALPRAQLLMMSATLGDTTFFETDLSARTPRPCVTVRSDERPVPLDWAYRVAPLHETLQWLLKEEKAPVYVVCFTQRGAAEEAQSATSLDVTTKEQKKAIKELLVGTRFSSPFGKDVKRLLESGIGLHHAGLLPKYRLAVERLARRGLLPLIFGTDTLGVGINVPIRTVLLTRLTKFDGEKNRVLTVRDFHQIAGRAGRKGFDARGLVVVQAPEHDVENKKQLDKAGSDPGKRKRVVMKKPPEGFVHYDEQTFEKLRTGRPEPLVSRFRPTHGMLLAVLSRPRGGCAAMKQLLRESHDAPVVKKRNQARARELFHSLGVAKIVELVPRDGAPGLRDLVVSGDVGDAFSLHHALSLFVHEALRRLDPFSPSYALDVLTLVEATLEDPEVVLMRQLDAKKREKLAELKAAGVEYDERMAELEKVKLDVPLEEFLAQELDAFSVHHPWVVREALKPKSVAREMVERQASFAEIVRDYELQRAEGTLLRYLGDAYRALVQSVPQWAKNDATSEVETFLRAVVRGTDASLLEEWERMREGAAPAPNVDERAREAEVDVTRDERGFRVLVRTAVLRFLRLVSRGRLDEASELVDATEGAPRWTGRGLDAALAAYREEHAMPRATGDAIGPRATKIATEREAVVVVQTLFDDEGETPFAAFLRVPLGASRERGEPVLVLERIAVQ